MIFIVYGMYSIVPAAVCNRAKYLPKGSARRQAGQIGLLAAEVFSNMLRHVIVTVYIVSVYVHHAMRCGHMPLIFSTVMHGFSME